jgi:TetR/AcrR family transcriptional regulator, cholesterol catabolism regulator
MKKRKDSEAGGGAVQQHSRQNTRKGKIENKREDILVAAARLFSKKGFEAATIRDIAQAVGMLSGSVYYHFSSKEEIFFAVYQAGIEQIINAVETAINTEDEPWGRLRAACVAHLTTLLQSPFSAVIAPNFAKGAIKLRKSLVDARNRHDLIFKKLIADLVLPEAFDERLMRLQLLGALNWTTYWYHANKSSPENIANHLVDMLEHGARNAAYSGSSKYHSPALAESSTVLPED